MSNALVLNDFYVPKDSKSIYHNASNFAGKPVVDYDAENTDDVVFRFRTDYDGISCEARLKEFLSGSRSDSAHAIVIGTWTEEMYETGPQDIINVLVEHKSKLDNLKAVYLGDVVSEENEMSWMIQSDLAPLLEHFPKLEYLRSRGASKLRFSTLAHEKLRALAIETGGLDVSVLRSISTAQLPSLEHLELWLGVEDYDGNCTVEDLQPILSGAVFPNLSYLGIRNYQHVDALCSVVVSTPLVQSLEVLDLSLGMLTDIGARALLKLPRESSIKRLILNHHYMSEPMVEELKQLPCDVEAGDAQSDDDGWRFVAVGE